MIIAHLKSMKSLTTNVRVQRKDHSLLLSPCLQRQVDQLLSASCPKQGFTKVDNMIFIHASHRMQSHRMQSNLKILLEKYEKFDNKCETSKQGSQFIT